MPPLVTGLHETLTEESEGVLISAVSNFSRTYSALIYPQTEGEGRGIAW